MEIKRTQYKMEYSIKHIARISVMLCIFLFVIQNVSSYAQTQYEFWPEVDGFISLNDQFRLFIYSAFARNKESDVQSLDLAGNIDISLKPLFGSRKKLKDWQRSRFLWVRLGYDYISKDVGGEASTPENRGMINIFAKAPLPAEIFLELRTRADLRWIGEEYSTRYRLRLEATREFFVFGHSIVPYLNCEGFYDTRYDGWARMLIMAGSEFTVSKNFRFELNVSPQLDYLPSRSNLLAFSVVAKFYI